MNKRRRFLGKRKRLANRRYAEFWGVDNRFNWTLRTYVKKRDQSNNAERAAR